MVDIELSYMSAEALGNLIARKEISPVEIVDNALKRIGEVNPRLNAFCFIYAEEALAAASRVEKQIARGEYVSKLHGIPFVLKDLTPTIGKQTTFGSRVFEDHVPTEQPAVVDRLIAAGAILMGKTTTPEFAHSGTTESRVWGTTRNPWNPNHTSGGSSGGSAVAVSTGCVPLAEGTDGGGSVRIPASCCGIFGLKPSLGRVPMTILPSYFEPILQFGPLARTVGDLRLMLQAMAGYDARDIQSLYLDPIGNTGFRSPISGRRIALSVDLGFYSVSPEVRAALEMAAERCRERGAVVEEVHLDWSEEIFHVWVTYWHVMLAAFFGQHLPQWREEMDPLLVHRIEEGLKVSAVELRRLEITRTRHWLVLSDIFERYDTLMCPTLADVPLRLGQEISALKHVSTNCDFQGYYMTLPFNLFSQCPAISVPLGNSTQGLPIGLQLVGRKFADNALIDLAQEFEIAGLIGFRQPPV